MSYLNLLNKQQIVKLYAFVVVTNNMRILFIIYFSNVCVMLYSNILINIITVVDSVE